MPADAATPEPGLPSPTIRTVVSFLIIVHLFAIFAALVFTPGMSSDLEQRFANVPILRQYRQALDMNLPYTYHLTFGGEDLDFDHQLEVDLELPDGSHKLVMIPPTTAWPRTRYNRYQMLAFNTALGVGQDGVESILPQGITAGLLDQYGATRANFRCRVHLALGRDRIQAGADPQAAETWRTVYDAAIWKTADGQIRLLKQESASDTAPSAAPVDQLPDWNPPTYPNSNPAAPGSTTTPPPADAPGPTAVPQGSNSKRPGMNRNPLTFPPSR